MTFKRDWKEKWVDEMGLIVALSGAERFARLNDFKSRVLKLNYEQRNELQHCIRQRFTPSNADSKSAEFQGCASGTEAVKEATA